MCSRSSHDRRTSVPRALCNRAADRVSVNRLLLIFFFFLYKVRFPFRFIRSPRATRTPTLKRAYIRVCNRRRDALPSTAVDRYSARRGDWPRRNENFWRRLWPSTLTAEPTNSDPITDLSQRNKINKNSFYEWSFGHSKKITCSTHFHLELTFFFLTIVTLLSLILGLKQNGWRDYDFRQLLLYGFAQQ